jgi:hypothetical protein
MWAPEQKPTTPIQAERSAGVNCRASVVMRNERGGEVLG